MRPRLQSFDSTFGPEPHRRHHGSSQQRPDGDRVAARQFRSSTTLVNYWTATDPKDRPVEGELVERHRSEDRDADPGQERDEGWLQPDRGQPLQLGLVTIELPAGGALAPPAAFPGVSHGRLDFRDRFSGRLGRIAAWCAAPSSPSLCLLLLVPVLAADAASGPSTGLLGLVKQAQGGTCLAGDPCDGIARNVELVFSRVGHPPRQVRSNGDGGFRVLLKPGRYTVRAAVDPAEPVRPSAVTVPL